MPAPSPVAPSPESGTGRHVALVTLGCARNEVDSEELAGRLHGGGWDVREGVDSFTDGPPEAVLVNTCGFVEAAKKDSIDTLLAAKQAGAKVIAVGCLAERYGNELASNLPEADAVLGFDQYGSIAEKLDDVLAGTPVRSHDPVDRRTLLPLSPARRGGANVTPPGHETFGQTGDPLAPAAVARTIRRRLGAGVVAPLKLASGCDRRCAFCAIPRFRGAFVSRRPADVLAEARWLVGQGVREAFLVSENSTSYGKDLGDLRLLEALLPELAAVEGLRRVRVSYLQPAELRPGLLAAIAGTPGVAPYFDLSFQHASGPVLRRMRRFGDRQRFLTMLASIRELAPEAGVRTNVIVGFPGETEHDLDELEQFLAAAGMDAIGVFGYSEEDGTEAAGYDGKLGSDEIADRVERITALADELVNQRAEDRVGTEVAVLLESVDGDRGEGRAEHQGPDVDGTTQVVGLPPNAAPGDIVTAWVTDSEGVDLTASAVLAARVSGSR